jgi:hypothetical protein
VTAEASEENAQSLLVTMERRQSRPMHRRGQAAVHGQSFGLIHPWSKHNLDHAVLLVPKSLIHLGRFFEVGRVCHDETRVYLSLLDFLE